MGEHKKNLFIAQCEHEIMQNYDKIDCESKKPFVRIQITKITPQNVTYERFRTFNKCDGIGHYNYNKNPYLAKLYKAVNEVD